MSTPILVAEGLKKQVIGPDAVLSILRHVDFQVNAGQAVAIVGASGAGKSTLLGILAGLDSADDGQLHLLGESVSQLDEDQRADLRAGKVGFVFQSFQLVEGLTALENVMLGLELGGEFKQARQLAAQSLQQVGLQDRLQHYPNQLSGGEQQRVAIARAFAPQPKILFADEPTGNLDEHTGQRIIDLLFELKQQTGVALVLVTHDESLAARCEQRYHLHDGELHS